MKGHFDCPLVGFIQEPGSPVGHETMVVNLSILEFGLRILDFGLNPQSEIQNPK